MKKINLTHITIALAILSIALTTVEPSDWIVQYFYPADSVVAARETLDVDQKPENEGRANTVLQHSGSLRTFWTATPAVSNVVYIYPRWIDEKVSGLVFGSNPSVNPPSRVEVEAGTGIYGLAWEHNDNADFTMQFAHGLATTNILFPQLYYDQHFHVSRKGGTGTNVQFRITYQIGPVWGSFSNSIVTVTNTLTLTNSSDHGLLSFGTRTNNLLSGKDSVVVRGNILRLDSGAGDVGSGAIVFIDSMDFHIPVDSFGSDNRTGD